MTEEEAKEYLKEILEEIEENHKNGELILVQSPSTKELKKAIEVVLKELEESKDTDIKLYKKLNMQERVIDEMAGMINTRDFGDICKEFGKYENCSNYIKEGLCEKCIKEYFYKKVGGQV